MSASSRARALLRSTSTGASLLHRPLSRRGPLIIALNRCAVGRRCHSSLRRPVGDTVHGWRAESGGPPGDDQSSKASNGEGTGSSVASETSESESESSLASTGDGGESTAASETSGSEAQSSEANPEATRGPEPHDELAVNPSRPRFAFAFDIDGVLLHSSKPLPGATETLKFLQKHRIPFLFLTNGGGKSEAERVAELSAKLGVDLDTSNFVQSHTPYRLLGQWGYEKLPANPLQLTNLPKYLKENVGVTSLRDSTVLVLGSDASKARHIANGYGFKSVVTPGDILKACPEIFPFNALHEFYDKQEILALPKPVYNSRKPDVKLEDCLKIDAILVFNDPRDWAVDIQLITDLLLSHRGYLGTYSPKNGDQSLPPAQQWQSDGQPALIFSNCDLFWSTGYQLSRFGQGAFRNAVHGNFRAIVGQDHKRVQVPKDFTFGKPSLATYRYALQVLQNHQTELSQQRPLEGESTSGGSTDEGQLRQPYVKTIYMVGDNPESDICGANRMNARLLRMHKKHGKPQPAWTSCLVRTGVWSEDRLPLEKMHSSLRPNIVKDDVKSTVKWALEQEGWRERLE